MEGIFPQNARLRIFIQASPLRNIISISLWEANCKLKRKETGYERQKCSASHYDIFPAKVNVSFECRIQTEKVFNEFLIGGTILFLVLHFDNISMLKRSRSMEFDSDRYKSDSTQIAGSGAGKEIEENALVAKKMCNSSNYEEGKSPGETDESPEGKMGPPTHGRSEPYRRYSQPGENAHVTQSRSIFSHEDGFVYGNPKEEIKGIENPPPGEGAGGAGAGAPFESDPSSALDLSFKGPKAEDERAPGEGNTYQNHPRTDSFPRSNPDVKPVNPPNKKPSLPEQLQIAKIQQQQRRSMQQQQKLLQHARRSLDPKCPSRQDTCQSAHKTVRHGNSANHEQNEMDNHARAKDEFPGAGVPGPHFPQFPYPYFDPSHPKELPDNHPILPLLDPVYFSALYNAHGFLPPSSPSIAAAFIGTLQDALPKLPAMFPSTSSGASPLLPQKGNDNAN